MTWPTVTLNDLQSEERRAITDGPFGSNLARRHYTEAGPRVVRLQNIGDGRFVDEKAHISEEHFESLRAHEVKAGDLLVASLGEVLPRACLAPVSLGPAIVKADCIRVRLRQDVDPRWVLYAMQRPEVRRWADEHRHGVGRPRLGLGIIRQIPVPLPPLDEQRRIVDVIEDHLSRLDAAETFVRDGLRRIAALRRAHLQEAFDEEAAELRPLLDVASIANGQTPKGLVEILSPEPENDSVPFFKVGDMNAADGRWMNNARFFVSCKSAEQLGIHVRPAGTVLIPKRGGAIATNKKRILRSPAAYDLNTMGLVPNDSLDSSYLWHWLQTVDLGRIADGSNVPQINATQIRELHLPVPDLQAQVAVANRLDEIDEGLTRLAEEVESVRRHGEGLRRALLSAAFTGRLTGAGSDPSQAEEMINA